VIPNSASDPDAWMVVGKIVSAQGLAGEVRIYPESDFPERFETPGTRWLRADEDTMPQPVQLEQGRYVQNKGLYIVKFAEVSDRAQAEALRGYWMVVPVADRLPLEDDEFHVQDLLGLSVIDQASGSLVGTVIDVVAAGNDLLVVQPSSTQSATVEDRSSPAPRTPTTTTQTTPQTSQRRSARPLRKSEQPQPILIPFVLEIVPVVDLAAQRVEITPPAGLIPALDAALPQEPA